MKIIITESQLKKLVESTTSCKASPSGANRDELVTISDILNGKTIKKGYCNDSEDSAIVKIQKMMKDKNYLNFDGTLGYYGEKTQNAVKELFLPDVVLGTEIGIKTYNKLKDAPKIAIKLKPNATSIKDISKKTSPSKYDDLTYDQKILVITLIGEAGGETYDGMKAVANVIKNRAETNFENRGSTMTEQMLSKKQFSMWNSHTVDGNTIASVRDLYKVKEHSKLADAIDIAKNIDTLPDNTDGSLYYYAGSKPYWAKETQTTKWKQKKIIGAHTFGLVVNK